MYCSLPGSSVHGIFQARELEWVAISFSRGSSRPRDWTQVFCIAGRRFSLWATRKPDVLNWFCEPLIACDPLLRTFFPKLVCVSFLACGLRKGPMGNNSVKHREYLRTHLLILHNTILLHYLKIGKVQRFLKMTYMKFLALLTLDGSASWVSWNIIIELMTIYKLQFFISHCENSFWLSNKKVSNSCISRPLMW